MNVVLGLDLSLRGLGMVAVPSDWGGDWSRIAHKTVGHPLTKDAPESARIRRLILLANAVLSFAGEHRCGSAIVEQYAFTSQNGQAHALGELGGVVKVYLQEVCKIGLEMVAPASARKLIVGMLPRKGVKDYVRGELTRMGMPASWTKDEGDAFVGANWGLSALDGFALVAPPGTDNRGRTAA
jgi:hypothetical protein